VSRWQGWSRVRAALPRAGCGPQSLVGLQEHQFLRGWHQAAELGETVVCARGGGEKGHFLPIFSFEDDSLQRLCPETLPWKMAIRRCWVLWGHLF